MSFDFVRQPLGIVMMQFFLLLTLFSCRAEFYPSVAELNNVTFSSRFALGGLADGFILQLGLIGRLITMCVVSINAVLITRIVTRNMVLGARTYIPILIYLIASCGIYVSSNVSTYLIATLIIQGAFFLIRAFRRSESFDFLFKGGLLLGITPLLRFEAIVMFIPIIFALIIFRRSTREAVVGFVGFLLPTALYSYIYWGMGYDFLHVVEWGWQSIQFSDWWGHYSINIGQMVVISLLNLMAFLALGAFFANITTMRNSARRIYIYFLLMLLLSIIIIITPFNSSLGYSLAAASATVVIPLYFVLIRNRLSSILFFALILSVTIINIFPFFY